MNSIKNFFFWTRRTLQNLTDSIFYLSLIRTALVSGVMITWFSPLLNSIRRVQRIEYASNVKKRNYIDAILQFGFIVVVIIIIIVVFFSYSSSSWKWNLRRWIFVRSAFHFLCFIFLRRGWCLAALLFKIISLMLVARRRKCSILNGRRQLSSRKYDFRQTERKEERWNFDLIWMSNYDRFSRLKEK